MFEVKDRRTGERTDVPMGDAVRHLAGVVRTLIDAVIFDWGGTLTRWHDIDFHAESLALAAAVVATPDKEDDRSPPRAAPPGGRGRVGEEP